MKAKKKRLVGLSAVFAILLVVVIVINAVVLYWSQALLLFFGTIGGTAMGAHTQAYTDDVELRQDLISFVRQVVDEGSILLKTTAHCPWKRGRQSLCLGKAR